MMMQYFCGERGRESPRSQVLELVRPENQVG